MNNPTFNIFATTSSPSLDVWWQGNDILYNYNDPHALKRGSCVGIADSKGFVMQICAALRRSQSPGLSNLAHMMFSYGMSSHVAHQDSMGVSIIWDRITRSDDRRKAVELAHGARLVYDVCAYALLRMSLLFKRCEEDSAPIQSFSADMDALKKEMDQAHVRFDEIEYGFSKRQ